MVPLVEKKMRQTTPLALGVATQVPQLIALEDWEEELKPGMLVAVNVAADQRGQEGAYWLAKLCSGVFQLPDNVLCCGQEFREGWLVAEGQWYRKENASLRGYKLQPEKLFLLVNAMVQIGNLKFSSTRGGPQQRELRSG
ncbi:MAG: hypothetical protein SGPRY_006642, partial [Prymnesium sp.]